MRPTKLQSRLLHVVLRVTSILGLVVCGPSVYAALRHGLVGIACVDVGALAVVLTLSFAQRLPYRPRALAICLVYFVVGMGLLAQVGAVGQVYLLGFCVVTVLLLGLAFGIGAAIASSVSMLAIGQWASTDLTSWIVISLNFAFVSTTLTLAIGTVLRSVDRERSTLRTLIDALPDVVFVKDTQGRIVECNAAMLALFGRESEDEVAGKNNFELFSDQAMAAAYHADDLAVMAGARLMNREEESVDASGNPLRYLTIKVPWLDHAGKVNGLVGISRDITALRRAEADRTRAEANAVIAAESNRAKSAFLAMMSHELRTPLNAIIGFSELLVDGNAGEVNERQRRFVHNVLGSGRHLLVLINGLLDLSKIEAGKMDVTRQAVSLRQVAQEAVTTILPVASARDVRVSLDTHPEVLPTVFADPVRCKQVLYNLLANAIRFTPSGGRVTISCATHGKRVRISVADTGEGIDQQDLARLFQPFTQLEQTRRQEAGGTGLGLALSKQLVELMGGEVGVTSERGVGSMFYFELPIGEAPRSSGLVTSLPKSDPLVLIVDDDPAARELFELVLGDAGYRTHAVTTGEAAIVAALRDRPAVILLDVFLPDIDGWDVLATLRASPTTVNIPVVIATISSDRPKSLELGAFEHLEKPIDRDVLLALMTQLVRPPA